MRRVIRSATRWPHTRRLTGSPRPARRQWPAPWPGCWNCRQPSPGLTQLRGQRWPPGLPLRLGGRRPADPAPGPRAVALQPHPYRRHGHPGGAPPRRGLGSSDHCELVRRRGRSCRGLVCPVRRAPRSRTRPCLRRGLGQSARKRRRSGPSAIPHRTMHRGMAGRHGRLGRPAGRRPALTVVALTAVRPGISAR